MGASSQIKIPNKHIIFFDGVCNLCNSSVDFIIKRDSKKEFIFESLQSNNASIILGHELTKSLQYIVVRTANNEILTKSKAVFFIASRLKGFVRTFLIFKILPDFVNDFFYQLIAKYRYGLFGKRNICRLPDPNDKLRFLEGYQNN